MSDLENIKAMVVDRGTFFPVAGRIAQEYGTVYSYKPNGEAFETVACATQGDGVPGIELVDEEKFWDLKPEIDVFVFPDCADGGIQKELESQGFPVWGSKRVARLERMRGKWHGLCKELGMPLPKTTTVLGISNLRVFLQENFDGEGKKLFVKISRFRGDMETWEAKTPVQVDNKLNYLVQRFGPLREHITFYVQEAVETDIEAGTDTYNVWGQWPDEVIVGYEKKGESYFATIKRRDELPEELWAGNEAITNLLKDARYCNFISSELRIKDDQSFWLDPCFRCPSPAGEEQLEMYKNFPRIVYEGAQGRLVQPDWAAQFCGEAVIGYTGDRDGWKSIEIPEEVSKWVKLYAAAYCDGAYHFPPSQDPEAIGCAVGLRHV